MLILITVILLLPTAGNQILRFTRSFSAMARVDNYQKTFQIFSKSPVLGVGYNNLCLSYQKYIGRQPFKSHACSGSDSSLLFVLATTGVVGLTVFVYGIISIFGFLIPGTNTRILFSSFAALLTHSIFSNSMFYPWIMGWMAILFGVSLRREVES